MLSSLTLADKNGTDVAIHSSAQGAKRVLTAAQGLAGISPVRESLRPRPTGHGAIDDARWTDGSLIVLEGECVSSVSIEDAFAEFRKVTEPMLQTLDNGPALLKWTEGDTGNALQRLVKLASDVDPPIQDGAAILRYQAQLRAEDPRAYGQTQTTTQGAVLSGASGGLVIPFTLPFTFNPSGGGQATFTLAGNRSTPPVFRIHGFCTSPKVRNVDTGEEIVLSGEVSAGDFMELDVAARAVKLNGTIRRVNLLDFTTTTWFELPPGARTIQLLATNFDASARVDVLTRPAFA